MITKKKTTDEPAHTRIVIHLPSLEQKEALEAAAEEAGLSLSLWCREILLLAAGREDLTTGAALKRARERIAGGGKR